jgi:hypothetical protein
MKMKLSHEIMNDVMHQENIANKKEYVGNAKEIRIHPLQFNELMREPEILNAVYVFENSYKLHGYPLNLDPLVEKWKVII